MLCYAMLCYAMLCYAMLCYAMLCYAMLCYAMLYYAMLCYGCTGTAPPGRTRKHWYAAPYPSSFHYHEGIKELPWDLPGTPPPPPPPASAYRSSKTHSLARVLSATASCDPAPPSDASLAPALVPALSGILTSAVTIDSNSSETMTMMTAAVIEDNSSNAGNR